MMTLRIPTANPQTLSSMILSVDAAAERFKLAISSASRFAKTTPCITPSTRLITSPATSPPSSTRPLLMVPIRSPLVRKSYSGILFGASGYNAGHACYPLSAADCSHSAGDRPDRRERALSSPAFECHRSGRRHRVLYLQVRCREGQVRGLAGWRVGAEELD